MTLSLRDEADGQVLGTMHKPTTTRFRGVARDGFRMGMSVKNWPEKQGYNCCVIPKLFGIWSQC